MAVNLATSHERISPAMRSSNSMGFPDQEFLQHADSLDQFQLQLLKQTWDSRAEATHHYKATTATAHGPPPESSFQVAKHTRAPDMESITRIAHPEVHGAVPGRLDIGAKGTSATTSWQLPSDDESSRTVDYAFRQKMADAKRHPSSVETGSYTSTDPQVMGHLHNTTTAQASWIAPNREDLQQHPLRMRCSSSLTAGVGDRLSSDSIMSAAPEPIGAGKLQQRQHLFLRDSDGSRRVVEVNPKPDSRLVKPAHNAPPPQSFRFVSGPPTSHTKSQFNDPAGKYLDETVGKQLLDDIRKPAVDAMKQGRAVLNPMFDFKDGVPFYTLEFPDPNKPIKTMSAEELKFPGMYTRSSSMIGNFHK